MKRIIKLLAVCVVLATVVLSTTSCGLLTAGIFDTLLGEDGGEGAISAEQEFYELVGSTKELLDTVSSDVSIYWYECLYENGHSGDIEAAIDKAISDNEGNINQIHENDERITELYKELNYSYSEMSYCAQEVMLAYNAYFTATLEVGGKTYDFYSAGAQSAMYTLSVALKNYYTEL